VVVLRRSRRPLISSMTIPTRSGAFSVMPESDASNATSAPQPKSPSGQDGSPPSADQRLPADELVSVDAAVAREMDALLEGEFESVDDVLDGLFAEHSGPLPVSAGEAVETAQAEPAQASQRVAFEPTAPPPVQTTIAAAGAGPLKDERPLDAPSAPSAPSDAIPEIIPTAKKGQPQQGESAQPTRLMVRPNSAADESQAEAKDENAPAPPVPGPGETGQLRRRNILVAAVIAVLLVMNLPLRQLPTSVRPLVDWIALSLVFWVPVTWVIALLVIGR
jgi:hypothetical protein